jgi:hypothetical protein
MGFRAGIREGLWWLPIVTILVVSPFLFRGTSNGHDLTFHVDSWVEVVRQWKAGIVYPHWAVFANYGNGEPRFVFYPPVSWTVGALLGLILPWQAVPGTFAALVCMAAGCSMFLFAREWLDDRTAVLAAILYAVNPYQLVVIYERGAFAEMIASIWIPGILLFALRERGGFPRNALLLALHVAAVWLTNLPAAVIASYLLAFVVAIRAVQLRRWEPLFRAATAMALGLTLAAFYLVPAIYEQRWVQIGQAVSSGASPKDNFLFAHTGDAEHDAVLLRTSIFAVIEFALSCALVGFAKELRQKSRAVYNTLLGIVMLSVFLMLPLSAIVWRFAPKLMFVQFPWRWLLVVNVALAVFAAGTFARSRVSRWALIVLVPLVITVCYWKFQQKIYDEDRPVALAEAIANGEGYEGTDEYTPLQADNSNLQAYMPRIAIQLATMEEQDRSVSPDPLAHSEFQRWDAEHKRFTIESRFPTRDTLRLLDYPAWSVKVDGRPFPRSVEESDGRMVLLLPEGHHAVAIDYERTPDRRWGMIVSLLALCACVGLWFVRAPRNEAANG